MKNLSVLTLIVCLIYLLSACASTEVITITSGGTDGISYDIGQSIQDVLEDTITDVVIKAGSGYGSYAGCVAVQEGKADVAIMQSDIAFLAYSGDDVFAEQPCADLSGIAAVYPSAVQLITIVGSNIESIEDLAGKRVSLGELGSRNYENVMHVLETNQVSVGQMTPYYYSLEEAVLAMENGELDALFFTGGYPNSLIVTLTQTKNIRVVPTVRQPETVQLIAALDAEIFSIEDLPGKTVSMGEEGAVIYADIISLVSAYGINADRIDQSYMTFAEAIAALKSGTLDAVFVSSNDPDYDFEEISENEDIASVPIDYTVLGSTEQTPYYSQTLMPANPYQGMDNSVAAMATMGLLVCNADMDEDLVYQLTKQFWENAAEIQSDSGMAYDLLFEKALNGMGIPLHPGAQKYYDEMAQNNQ